MREPTTTATPPRSTTHLLLLLLQLLLIMPIIPPTPTPPLLRTNRRGHLHADPLVLLRRVIAVFLLVVAVVHHVEHFVGPHGPDGEASLDDVYRAIYIAVSFLIVMGGKIGGDKQHVHRHGKRPLGHLAALDGIVRDGEVARFADVPRCPARVSRVGVVWSGLSVHADGVERGEGDADCGADDGVENLHDGGDHLGEEDEEGDDGDGHVEGC